MIQEFIIIIMMVFIFLGQEIYKINMIFITMDFYVFHKIIQRMGWFFYLTNG